MSRWWPWLLAGALVLGVVVLAIRKREADAAAAAGGDLSTLDKLASGICQGEAAVLSQGKSLGNSSTVASCNSAVAYLKPRVDQGFKDFNNSTFKKYTFGALDKLPLSRYGNPFALPHDVYGALGKIF